MSLAVIWNRPYSIVIYWICNFMVKTVIQNEKICESNTFDHSSGPCGLVQLCCTPDDFPSVVHEPPYQLVLMMAQTNKIIVRGSLIRPKNLQISLLPCLVEKPSCIRLMNFLFAELKFRKVESNFRCIIKP